MTERTNEEWVKALKPPPDEAAVGELRAYIRRGLARALAKHGPVDETELDDYTQDAVLRVLDKLDTFRGKARLTTWAVTVAVRVAFTALRKKRWKVVSIDDLDAGGVPVTDGAPHPDRVAEKNDLIAALAYAIDHDLTEKQRTVILAELQGMPGGELAKQLGTNPNALYKVYHDARKKLRKSLEDAGYSLEDVRSQLAEASN